MPEAAVIRDPRLGYTPVPGKVHQSSLLALAEHYRPSDYSRGKTRLSWLFGLRVQFEHNRIPSVRAQLKQLFQGTYAYLHHDSKCASPSLRSLPNLIN